ncbi:MAG: hypothetical protein IPN29_19955 [Saprospiraceae bacterium]|nr:hypothetical protein [Saprospiraceae bacterium]
MVRKTYYTLYLLVVSSVIAYGQYNLENSGTFNLEFQSPDTIQVGEDQHEKVPIGFSFEYYGNTYDSIWVDFHGYITFAEEAPFFCCMGQQIPDTTKPNNLIAACWADPVPQFDDGNGFLYNEYQHEIIGSAPDRICIVTFDFNVFCGENYFGQIKLFEGSNRIEIHTDNWNELGGNCAESTQGIENENGTNAFFDPTRNQNFTWSLDDDYIAFVPIPDNDIGIVSTNYTVCEGNQNIFVWVYNYGNNVVNNYEVYWYWDAAFQDTVFVTDTINPGEYKQVLLGSKIFGGTGDQHLLYSYTSDPNGNLDENPANDDLTATISSGLHGTFTVGGTTPDFSTLNDAVTSLESYGACDSVWFKIRPGTYNEQIDLGYFNSVYTVFQSENGDSTSVIIENGGDYVVRLHNVFNVHFKQVSIKTTSIPLNGIFEITNYCVWNSINQCVLEGSPSNFENVNAIIYISGHAGELELKNNVFKYGSYAVFMAGYNEGYRDNVRIINNDMLDFTSAAIIAIKTTGLKISGNTIRSNSNVQYGISCNDDEGNLWISDNTNYFSAGCNSGIFLKNTTNPTIINNMLGIDLAYFETSGILLNENVFGARIMHNSILFHSGSYSNSRVIYSNLSSIDSMVNNALINRSEGYVYQIDDTSLSVIDHNLIYTSGDDLAILNNTNLSTQTQLRNAGFEIHGYFHNPVFMSNEDLHTMDPALNRGGTNTFVVADIDGDPRDLLLPDIGYDEFDGPQYDVSVIKIISPSSNSCSNSQELEVLVRNGGEENIDSLKVTYNINNGAIEDSVWVYQSVVSGDTININIGSISLIGGDSFDIKVYVSQPNGMDDEFSANDTFNQLVTLPMQGVFTIGGVSPDFTTIQAAFTKLSSHGICGPVFFNIRDGLYTEQILADSVPGVSAQNTITLQSESMDSNAVLIQYDQFSQDYVMTFRNAKHLTIKYVRIKNAFSYYGNAYNGNVLLFTQKGRDITIKDCSISTPVIHPSGNGTLINFSPESNGRFYDIDIQNNQLLNAHHQIICTKCDSVKIINNNLQSPRFRAIYHEDNVGVIIKNNQILKTSTYFDGRGIEINGSSRGFVIDNNKLSIEGSGEGVFISASNAGSANSSCKIYNNFITTNTSAGIKILNSQFVDIWHNNVNCLGTNAESNALLMFNSDSLNIRNNVLKTNNQAIVSQSLATPSDILIDYNVYYTAGGIFGRWATTNYTDITGWQGATGLDTHSYFADPGYVSDFDLHILSDTIDGKAQIISGINSDIDGSARHINFPDIGGQMK